MADESVVTHELDETTTHAVVAAQLRGEARVEGEDPSTVVRSIAAELQELGLEPNVADLERRYHIGETRVPESLRQRM